MAIASKLSPTFQFNRKKLQLSLGVEYERQTQHSVALRTLLQGSLLVVLPKSEANVVFFVMVLEVT